MQLTESDLLNVERELCRRSLAHFARRAWHVLEPAAELKWGWALDAICEHLEAVTDGRITRLLMNVPPGSMKSLLTGVIWPAWEWGPKDNAWKRFVGTAHEETLAIRDSRRCRDLIKSEWYQKLWPLELASDLDGKREFGNVRKGIRQARAFTSMTGVRGDCLLAGSMIQTEDGIKDIKEIVDSSYTGNVLSYDHDSNRLVYRPIEAVARRSSGDFYRIHFADGSMVECTGDHRIYTARGYVEARLLSEGDDCLRVLQRANNQNSRRNEEVREKRMEQCDMLEAMQSNFDKFQAREDWEVLQHMWGKNPQEPQAMLREMQGGSIARERIATQERHGDVYMSCVRERKTTSILGDGREVLFNRLQERPSCIVNEREEQPWMAGWRERKEIRQGDTKSISHCQRDCSECRQEQMCRMRINKAIALPSYRSQFDKQCSMELGYVVPGLPYETPWSREVETENVSVSMVERVCQGAEVFDIQISGTHCFFANGILVHNCIILDDPISADNANSEAKLEAARLAFTETLPTRVNSDKSAIVVIMQRLNEKDVSGVILEMGLPYVHLCIPMRFEKAHRCSTEIGWSDPRTEDGELMFPGRFSEKQVSELEDTLGSYGAAGQLQQRPSPRGGGILKEEWYKYYSSMPRLEYRAIFVDTAQKTEEKHDYSVLQCWGRSLTGEAVLVDQLRGKWEAPELLVNARAFWMKHLANSTSTLRAMMVEDKVSGTGLIQTLRREGIPIIPIQRNKDKISRAHDTAPFIESGNVLLPIDAPWLSDFLSESSAFPGGAHDDQLDPMFDAVKSIQTAIIKPKTQNVTPLPSAHRW